MAILEQVILMEERPVAPSLIRFEVGHICLTKIRLRPAERARLLDALRLLDHRLGEAAKRVLGVRRGPRQENRRR